MRGAWLAAGLFAMLFAATSPAASGTGLSPAERRLAASVDRNVPSHLALLRRLVEQNSGTLNLAGVRAVGAALQPEWEALGFRVRWVDGAAWNRAGHLLAERQGRRGAPVVVLVGHLDTVFEPSSGFEGWTVLSDTTVRGPGITDMKGGDVIQLLAVHALRDAGLLDGLTIRVVLSGDEERPGSPLALARADLVAAAAGASAVLGFEDGDGALHRAVTARRGSSSWTLRVRGTPAHSSQIFRDDIGPGAIFEAARVLAEVRDSLASEPYLTFNPGFVLGGSDLTLNGGSEGGAASGKTNVVADTAYVAGDLRTLSRAQLEHARAVMTRIASRHDARTDAAFTFSDGYPVLEPSEGNRRLLALFDRASRDLGLGAIEAVDPMRAGAADVSFVGDRVPMTLDALGLKGDGGHTSSEWADLRALPIQGKRVAVLLARLAAGAGRSAEAAGH